MTFARAAAPLLAALLAAGCSTLDASREPKPEAAPRAEPAYRLDIQAPDAALRTLLEQHLDLARFRTAAAGTEAPTPAELDRLVAATPAQARALLETEGYFNADVRAERHDGGFRVVVQPGPRTLVERVTIEAQGDLQSAIAAGDAQAIATLEALRRSWSLPAGQPFRQSQWDDAKKSLLAQLRAAGYAAATWSGTSAQVDPRTQRARLLAIAESGPLFHIGEIQVDGLVKHDERSVRRLADFGTGAVATEQRLLDYQERLVKAGLFEGAVVEIDADPAHAVATPLHVRVRESPLQQATVGVGISANTGPRVTLEHVHRRAFGRALTMKNEIEVGRDRTAWEFELDTHPLPNLYRNLTAAQIERLATADEVRKSWSARLGRTQDTGRIERLYFIELQSSEVNNAAGSQRGDALSLNYHGTWRKIDNVILPTRGITLNGESAGGYARSNFADSGPFGRLYARLTGYLPIGSWYGQARIELGQVFAADRVGLPDTLLFRAGGDESVRGYGYRTLGPIVNGVVTSGRVLATGSVEMAHPLTPRMPSLWGAVFIDAGNAADRWQDFAAALGYGVGVRWRSPVGPLRVDLAYGEEVHKFRLSFSVGIVL
jgi:translocation and assembly module TamA